MNPQAWNAVLFQYSRYIREGSEAGGVEIRLSAERLIQFLNDINKTARIPVEPRQALLDVFD
jgi:hypothetical protein